jgi:hypothetical protein
MVFLTICNNIDFSKVRQKSLKLYTEDKRLSYCRGKVGLKLVFTSFSSTITSLLGSSENKSLDLVSFLAIRCLLCFGCLEDKDQKLLVFPSKIENGRVWISPTPQKTYITNTGASQEKMKLVLVGNGLAGMRCLEDLLDMAPDRYEVTVIGEEPWGNYNRIMLSPVLSGDKTIDDIMLHPHAWYSDKGIRFIAGDPAVRIDRPRKQVYTEKGEVVDYDRLILATGSQRAGASKAGIVGSIVGTVVGIPMGLFGIFVMPLVGAAVGEFWAKRDLMHAGRVGVATWVGMIVGTAVKVALAFTMTGYLFFIYLMN